VTDPRDPDLVDAVLDSAAIDWTTVEAGADEASRLFLRDLKLVASVSAFQRAVAPGSEGRAVEWGHLRLLDRVGHGASGEIFRAWDTKLDREVALKLLSTIPVDGKGADPGALTTVRGDAPSIIREGRLLAKVRHPNVVTIYGAEQIGDRIGFWMELVRGSTLEELLRRRSAFGPAEVIGIGIEVCRAVSAVHAAGLLHRDIKAHNVMRADDGRVVLMDFGAGRALDDDSADVAGTPLYLAPELFGTEPATIQTDIYSLGVLLYRLATGSYPVRGTSIRELRSAHERGTRVSTRNANAGVGAGLARVIDQAIDPQPGNRPASAAALAENLVRLQQRERRKPFVYAASVVLVAAGIGTAWAVRGRSIAPVQPSPAPGEVTLSAGSAASAPPPVAAPPGTPPQPPAARETERPTPPTGGASAPRTRPAGLRRSVQVLPMTNVTAHAGDSWLSATLAELLLRDFRGSEAFRWIPGEVSLAKAQLGTAMAESSRTIRPATPADIVVSGEYSVIGSSTGPATGSGLRLTVRIEDRTDAGRTTVLTEEGAVADLIAIVSRLGNRARAALGAPALTDLQTRALFVSQPANVDAARAYAEGLSKTISEQVELMDKAIDADPRFAPAYAALAEAWTFKKDAAKAQAAAARAVELALTFPFEERLLIEVRASNARSPEGPPTEAAVIRQKAAAARDATFQKLFVRYPDTLLYGLETARAHERGKRGDEALFVLTAIGHLPGAADHLELQLLEARLARFAKDFDRARLAIERAERIAGATGNPQSRTILSERALVALHLGEPAKAVKYAQSFLEAGGNVENVNNTLAIAYRDLGDLPRARAVYEWQSARAKENGVPDGGLTPRLTLATMLVDHGHLAESRTMLEQLLAEAPARWPNRPNTAFALVRVLQRQGQFDAARTLLERFPPVVEGSWYAEAWLLHRMARLDFDQGRVATAREQVTRSVQLLGTGLSFPEDLAAALADQARILLAVGETTVARVSVGDAVRLAGSRREVLAGNVLCPYEAAMVQASVAMEEGRPADAIAAAKRAIAFAHTDVRKDDEAAAEAGLAVAFLASGNLAEARRAIVRMEPRLKITEDRLLHLSGGFAAARVLAASKVPADVRQARQRLEALIGDAEALGAVALAFDGRLLLGEIEISAGDSAGGKPRLAALEKDAADKGFVSVAKRARASAGLPARK
jgi:serine/threonine-protein kinase